MVAQQLWQLDSTDPSYATCFVDVLLAAAQQAGASDIHLQPTAAGLDVRWRLDGVLQPVGVFAPGEAADVITRLKVLAELLTYRTEVPQEGRMRRAAAAQEIRVSTFPTLHGERAVIRLFPTGGQLLYLPDLGFSADVAAAVVRLSGETSGALVLAGPAGSGKTTTIYACLREIARQSSGGRSLVSLEDPIEVAVEGVSQAQIQPAAGFDFASGVRSVMRQDPDVIMIGEIRDRPTAEAAFTASLTGHLVLTTFHAGSAAGALARLADLGIEPFLLRSGLRAILCQRLVRRLCGCAREERGPEQWLGLPIRRAWTAQGCAECLRTGYRGRFLLAELLPVTDGPLAEAILRRADAETLARVARDGGVVTLWERACAVVEEGRTSCAEVRRVLGFPDRASPVACPPATPI